jgi:hypothetical protein
LIPFLSQMEELAIALFLHAPSTHSTAAFSSAGLCSRASFPLPRSAFKSGRSCQTARYHQIVPIGQP